MELFGWYLLAINVVTFAVYGIDKFKAKRGMWRIKEATLLGLAVAGGSIGAILGMYLFRHKTKKPAFTVGVPLIILAQAAVLFYLTNM
ncbi:MAG: DUF1294 domain-containing protein [Eggerthellaceae bacterium]|nr:DUF1294 domain-containing protein [Eggerthellaceae bacterium]